MTKPTTEKLPTDDQIRIIFAYGLSDDETAAAVRATIAARDGDVRLAALDYIEANPGVPLDIIERAIRECLAR